MQVCRVVQRLLSYYHQKGGSEARHEKVWDLV
jgi:hypothetical protein